VRWSTAPRPRPSPLLRPPRAHHGPLRAPERLPARPQPELSRRACRAEKLRDTRQSFLEQQPTTSFKRPSFTPSSGASASPRSTFDTAPPAPRASQPDGARAGALPPRTDYKALARQRFAEAEAAIAAASHSAMTHLEQCGYPLEASPAAAPWQAADGGAPRAAPPETRLPLPSPPQQQAGFQERLRRHEERLSAMRSGRTPAGAALTPPSAAAPPWAQPDLPAYSFAPLGKDELSGSRG